MTEFIRQAVTRARVSAIILGLIFGSMSLFSGPVFAAGDSPRPAPSPAEPSPSRPDRAETKSCPPGQVYGRFRGKCVTQCRLLQVWSDELRKCVSRFSEILTDDDLYAEARFRADQGEHQQALDLLWRIKNQKQAKVLNYIGYNTRKLGRVKEGISYYLRALAINPNYNQAREYLGEGYLQTGHIAKAEAELVEIKMRCGKACNEYQQLAKAIFEFRSRMN
ncbi:hypothetical protein MnTg02_00753 [bacterium MnTg02]|nr:hypothetical protein MnTg02_00753 [bacterium MnTg02]